jgi:hypothetical protein
MHPFSTTLRHHTRPHIRGSCALCRTIVLLLLGILCAAPSLLAGVSNYFPQHSRIATAHFAIADFDGDQRPDLATVRAERTSQPFSSYSIHLKFSASPDSTWDLIAPDGGLEILARDVNGDNATDLVISTAWRHLTVAVLLNNGHGRFELRGPGTAPATVWNTPDSKLAAPNGDDEKSAAGLRAPVPKIVLKASQRESLGGGNDAPGSLLCQSEREVTHLTLRGRAPPQKL